MLRSGIPNTPLQLAVDVAVAVAVHMRFVRLNWILPHPPLEITIYQIGCHQSR